jgi:hypothetical protein
MNVKTLSATQFIDSLQQNVYLESGIVPGGGEVQGRAVRQAFLRRMKVRGMSAEDYPHGVVQTLGMMNGPEMALATDANRSPLLVALEAPLFDDSQRIETLFLATVSRRPTAAEQVRFGEHLAAAESESQRRAAMSDLLWILLNTAECAVCP